MSAQSPSIILGQRVRPAAEDLTASDLQQMVGKLLSILRYRRWLFVLPLLTGVMAVLVGSLLVPRQYLLRTVFERRDDPVLLKLVENSPFKFEMQRQALRYNVAGHGAIAEAVEQAGLDIAGASPPAPKSTRQATIAGLAARMHVILVNSTPSYDLIELNYTGEQPELAEQILPRLRDNYIRKTQEDMRNVQRNAQQFFAREVEKRRSQAVRMQAEMTQVLMEHPEVDPNRPEWLNQRLLTEKTAVEELARQKHELDTEILARREYLRQLDEQQAQGKMPSKSVFTTRTVENAQRNALQGQIAQLTGEIADAKTVRHMKDTHPYVESLNRKLKQLNIEFERVAQEIAGQVTGGGSETPDAWDSERQRIAMEIKTFAGKLEQVERDLAGHQDAVARLEGQKATVFERQQSHMLRAQELNNVKADLGVWQSKLEEINRILTAENVERGVRFRTVEECRRPLTPASPKLSALLMLSLAVGLALAVVAVAVRELLDRTCRNPARVRQLLGIPVLETIEEIIVRPCPRVWLARYVLPAAAVLQTGTIVALGWLLYLSLERPDTYARWVQTLTLRLTDMRAALT